MRPVIAGALALAGAAYAIGWLRLGRRARARDGWRMRARLALALGGLGTVASALLPPLDDLAHRLFAAHMAQHVLLVMVAAPALLLADPLPMLLWALPAAARARAGRLLVRGAPLRRAWAGATAMRVTWPVSALVLWLWHLPPAYESALAHPPLHHLEHLTLFGGAALFWWPVIDPAPRVRRAVHAGWRIVYLLLGAFQSAGLGLLLALSPAVLYPSYEVPAAAWGLTALEDQAWGGVVMWGAGGAIDMLAILILVFRFLRLHENPRGAPPFP